MPFQPAPSIAGVTIQGKIDSQLTINDLYFFASGPITGATLFDLGGAVASWVTGSLAPLLSDDLSFFRVVCTDLGTATGPAVETPLTITGGVSGEANPNNVAACVSFRTEQRGRSARGRNFVPGIPGTLVTLNTLDSGFIQDLVDAYSALIGPGDFVTGWQWVVLSRVTAGAPRTNGIGIPITNVLMVGNSVRSMRSREIGHGA